MIILGALTCERRKFMRRSTMSKVLWLSGFVGSSFAAALLVPNRGLAESDSEVCQIGEGFSEALSLADVKFSFSERENGYVILVTSANPSRKDVIRKMVFELLKEKSLQTHEATDGYGLNSH